MPLSLFRSGLVKVQTLVRREACSGGLSPELSKAWERFTPRRRAEKVSTYRSSRNVSGMQPLSISSSAEIGPALSTRRLQKSVSCHVGSSLLGPSSRVG